MKTWLLEQLRGVIGSRQVLKKFRHMPDLSHMVVPSRQSPLQHTVDSPRTVAVVQAVVGYEYRTAAAERSEKRQRKVTSVDSFGAVGHNRCFAIVFGADWSWETLESHSACRPGRAREARYGTHNYINSHNVLCGSALLAKAVISPQGSGLVLWRSIVHGSWPA